MPSRTAFQADLATKKARDSRWRYCLRNPTFRKELASVSRLTAQIERPHSAQTTQRYQQTFDSFLKKWGFSYLLPELLLMYNQLRNRPAHEIVAHFDKPGSYVLSFPVFVDEFKTDDVLMHLTLDLRHPPDVLMALVEQELQERIGDQPRRRRRLDKVDFYLDIYDRAVHGERFASIAHALKQRVSTVKSAYATALRNIDGRAPTQKKRDLTRSTFDRRGFDLKDHYANCADCKKATTADEMCALFRGYAVQDHKGQRERPGYDTTRS